MPLCDTYLSNTYTTINFEPVTDFLYDNDPFKKDVYVVNHKMKKMHNLFTKIILALVFLFSFISGQDVHALNTVPIQKPAFLPYHLTINSVTAIRNADSTVSINWVVEKEIGTRQYNVERSTDGIHFSTFEIITNTNNNGGREVYGQLDSDLLHPVTFYRIMAKSLTGKLHYSVIVKVCG